MAPLLWRQPFRAILSEAPVRREPRFAVACRIHAGQRVALATRRGKQRVIVRALRQGLGAELLHLADPDADRLGSLCGTVELRGHALEACIVRAELALAHGDSGLAKPARAASVPARPCRCCRSDGSCR